MNVAYKMRKENKRLEAVYVNGLIVGHLIPHQKGGFQGQALGSPLQLFHEDKDALARMIDEELNG